MSMIGNTPGVSSQRTVLEEVVTGSPKSAFVPQGGYIKGYVDVLVNGTELDTSDFTAADGITINLAVAAAVGDTVKVKAWLPRGLSDGYRKDEVDTLLAAIYTKTESNARYAQIDTNTVYVDIVNHRLGVGTSAPSKKFVVSNNGANGIEFSPDDAATGTLNRLLSYNRSASAYTPLVLQASIFKLLTKGTSADESLNVDANGYVNLGVAPASNASQLNIGGYNQVGGTGYHGFLALKNTYASATNPNKYFRLSAAGAVEIINSAYTSTILAVDDSGNLSFSGSLLGGSVPLDRLTSSGTSALGGTANSSTFLRGDGSWQTPVAGLTQVSYSQAGSGYLRLSNGFMIQWGITQYIADYGRAFQSFPTSFPNGCFSVTCQNVDSEDSQWMDNIRVYDLTTSGFTMFRRGNNSRNWFIAIGY